ncbi:uncharacterized protein LOC119732000 [Patiria miniata]|uniref:Saposin B-type domain-containing protein n=1 Tax=Patiria miniata TaxID=46514 RepID=A0A914AD53_PATMI|nr:uncharacterized protein LOC119732000 [Patiria miniata]
MAVGYYCLVGVLLLSALVSGQGDVPVAGQEELPVQNGFYPEFPEMIPPMLGGMAQNPYLCKACEAFIEFLKNATENKQLLDDVVTLLLPLCDWAPYQYHNACIAYVQAIPGLVKMYADMYLNPQTDCAAVCAASRMGYDPNAVPMMMNNLAKMMQGKKPIG